jgi:hypothetical protein
MEMLLAAILLAPISLFVVCYFQSCHLPSFNVHNAGDQHSVMMCFQTATFEELLKHKALVKTIKNIC